MVTAWRMRTELGMKIAQRICVPSTKKSTRREKRTFVFIGLRTAEKCILITMASLKSL